MWNHYAWQKLREIETSRRRAGARHPVVRDRSERLTPQPGPSRREMRVMRELAQSVLATFQRRAAG